MKFKKLREICGHHKNEYCSYDLTLYGYSIAHDEDSMELIIRGFFAICSKKRCVLRKRLKGKQKGLTG